MLRSAPAPAPAFSAAIALAAAGCAAAPPPPPDFAVPVLAVTETQAVESRDDAADDPAIWRNSDEPTSSVVFGTDKQAGLYAYDLEGRIIDFVPVGRVNNADLRSGWPGGDGPFVLIAATERSRKVLAFLTFDPETRTLTHLADQEQPLDVLDPYGVCMGKIDGPDGVEFHVVANSKDGAFRQFVLEPTAQGGVRARENRRFAFDSIVEGCAVDDRTGEVFIGEEMVGVWRMDIAPGTNDTRTPFAMIADHPQLAADVEGIALAAASRGGGTVIVSSQGNSTFAAFDMDTGRYLASFQIRAAADGSVDAVSGTDGIDLILGDFGPRYPGGLFVSQDDVNDGADTQNFKFTPWAAIRDAIGLQP